jgi:hypothetical protein
MQIPNFVRLSRGMRGIYCKVRGTGRNSISTNYSLNLRMSFSHSSPFPSFAFSISLSLPRSSFNRTPLLLLLHMKKSERQREIQRRRDVIKKKRINGFDRKEKLISRIIAYWENFSLHAFENTTQNFFQPTSLTVGEGMVDCSCCYTIRRDVSLSWVSSSFPLPRSNHLSFDYPDYCGLSLVAPYVLCEI